MWVGNEKLFLFISLFFQKVNNATFEANISPHTPITSKSTQTLGKRDFRLPQYLDHKISETQRSRKDAETVTSRVRG